MDTTRTEDNRPSPFRALLWKEWRESWFMAVLSLATLVLCGVGFAVAGFAQLLFPSLPIIAVALCLLLGAGTIAREHGQGTDSFLASLPSGRTREWLAKALPGLGLSLLYCATGLVLARVLGGRIESEDWLADAREWQVVLVPGVGFSLFAVGMFASAMARDVIMSFLLGAILWSVALWGCLLALGFSLWFVGLHVAAGAVCSPFLLFFVAALMGLYAYRRHATGTSVFRRAIACGIWLVLAVFVAGVLPATVLICRFHFFVPPEEYAISRMFIQLSRNSKWLSFEADTRWRSDVWLCDLEKNRVRKITAGVEGSWPSMSPDGKWIVLSRGMLDRSPPSYTFPRYMPSWLRTWRCTAYRIRDGFETVVAPSQSFGLALWMNETTCLATGVGARKRIVRFGAKGVESISKTPFDWKWRVFVASDLPSTRHCLLIYGLSEPSASPIELALLNPDGQVERKDLPEYPRDKWRVIGLSPDAEKVLLEGELKGTHGEERRALDLVEIASGRTRRVFDEPMPFDCRLYACGTRRGLPRSCFSPEGKYVVLWESAAKAGGTDSPDVNKGAALMVVDIEAETARHIDGLPASMFDISAYAPDDPRMVWAAEPGPEGQRAVWRIDLPTGRAQRLQESSDHVFVDLFWPKKDRLIVVRKPVQDRLGEIRIPIDKWSWPRSEILWVNLDGTDERVIFPPE